MKKTILIIGIIISTMLTGCFQSVDNIMDNEIVSTDVPIPENNSVGEIIGIIQDLDNEENSIVETQNNEVIGDNSIISEINIENPEFIDQSTNKKDVDEKEAVMDTITDKDKSIEIEYRRITSEEYLDFIGLSIEEIPYLNIDKHIDEYNITTEVLEKGKPELIRQLLIEENAEEKEWYDLMNASYLQLSVVESIEKPKNFNFSICTRIGVYYIHENGGPAFVIDKIDNKVYYGSNVLKNKNNAEITVDLTDDILTDIVSRIEEANLADLEYSYISQENINARNSWGIAFECEEGIVRYYVYNAMGEEPSRIINCVHDLLEYAEGLAE